MHHLSIHRQNLEALEANADVVQELTGAMDDALLLGTLAFKGGHYGPWTQTEGRMDPTHVEAARSMSQGLLEDIREIHLIYAAASGRHVPGIGSYNRSDVTLRGTGSAEGNTYYLRRFRTAGDVRESTTADHYRFEWQEGGTETPKNYFILAHIGDTAVRAELWCRPNEEEFAKRCFDTFVNKQIVNDVLRGDFTDETMLDGMLRKLIVLPANAALLEELRSKALATRQSLEMITEFNAVMPNRDQLMSTLGVLRSVF